MQSVASPWKGSVIVPTAENPRQRRASAREPEQHRAWIAYTVTTTIVGDLLLAATPRGLARVAFQSEDFDSALAALAARTGCCDLQMRPSRVDAYRRQFEEYLEHARQDFTLPLDWNTPRGFARRVLDSTARIPYGSTASYATVARQAGSPCATRATGNALGANPLPVVVPCHRVVRTDGSLGGFAGGSERKRALLQLESANLR